jgi:hypothetical protein
VVRSRRSEIQASQDKLLLISLLRTKGVVSSIRAVLMAKLAKIADIIMSDIF